MIAIGCDHAATELKNKIKNRLESQGLTVKDFGCHSNQAVDYPDYAIAVAKAVASGECEKGVLICGTGIGMSIAANKVKGIRCALCGDTFSARATREHNNANILALGQRVTGEGLALDIVDVFFGTAFSGDERHMRRIEKITQIEEQK
ncbi:MAG: ribose 5-phosphate isomerase B [Clostridia bacterium]|nr:ribose 5-phosphate isomerase B [Clostridia bacterium]